VRRINHLTGALVGAPGICARPAGALLSGADAFAAAAGLDASSLITPPP
jgi:hypothetical protein